MIEEFKVPHFQVRSIIIGVSVASILTCSWLNQYLMTILVIFLLSGNRPYWLYVLSKTFKRDMILLKRGSVAVFRFWLWDKKNMTLPKFLKELSIKHPSKPAIYAEKRTWSFRQLSDLSNRMAHMFKRLGLQRGETVGLMISNGGGPEFAALWVAAATLGAPAALLPPQLKGQTLIHAISVANLTMLVFSDDLQEVIEEIMDDPIFKNIKLFQYNLTNERTPLLKNSISVDSQLALMPNSFLKEEMAKGGCNDILCYIYTSGTTGLPKAAIIRHKRYCKVVVVSNSLGNINSNDIVYSPLPMHHTAGGVLGLGQALIFGVTIVHRGKFSASNFWKDCVKYKCTVAQYIGEICRFLLLTAEKSGEADPAGPHRVRLMIGNGLRTSIWEQFQKTFRVPYVCEIYGSTEGSTNLLNCSTRVGAVGFIPRFLSPISPIAIVKCDEITGEPLRNESGYCIPCKPCEPGLIIGKLDLKKMIHTFTGYVNEKENKSKIMRSVFKDGDAYFNSGDILTMDHYGYFYFKNRTGDTFRWRGENVSTEEVENVIGKIIGIKTPISVYGVQIPNIEGKAGMAAIADPNKNLDFEQLRIKMDASLPRYAFPIFIRIIDKFELTFTFKVIKRFLQVDGFDVNKFTDLVYFLDPKTQNYVPLTKSLHNDILNGKIRL